MITKFTTSYIKNQATKLNITNYDTSLSKLYNYCSIIEGYGYELDFRKGRSLNFNSLNANAGLFQKSSIVVTPEWAKQLVLYDSPELENIFILTFTLFNLVG